MQKEIIVLGNLWEDNGFDSAGGRVYSGGGISCCISSTTDKHPIHILVNNDERRKEES